MFFFFFFFFFPGFFCWIATSTWQRSQTSPRRFCRAGSQQLWDGGASADHPMDVVGG